MLDHDAELQSGEWQNGDRHIARAHLSAGVILWTVWRRQGLVWQCASVITFNVLWAGRLLCGGDRAHDGRRRRLGDAQSHGRQARDR